MWKYKNNQKLKTPEKMSQICKPVRRAMLHFCIIIVEDWEWHLGCVSIPLHNHPSHAALFCGGGVHKKKNVWDMKGPRLIRVSIKNCPGKIILCPQTL